MSPRELWNHPKYGVWAKGAAIVAALILFNSVSHALWQNDPVHAFGENILGTLFVTVVPVALFAGAIAAGWFTSKRTNSNSLGWIAGLATFVLATFAQNQLENALGLDRWLAGAREEADRCYIDWDGRSNPTVCE